MRKLILVFAVVVGLLTVFAGVGIGLALLVVGQPAARNGVSSSVLGGVFGLLAIVLGLPLAWSGTRALSGVPGRPLRLPGWFWLLLSTIMALVLGQGLLSRGLNWPVPLFHVAAGALPALLFLSLTAGAARRRGGQVSGRAATGSLAWGGLGGIGIALSLELILMVIGAVAAFVWLQMAAPDLAAQLQDWANAQMGGGTGELPDMQILSTLTGMPLAILAALGFIGIIAPAIEETGKTLALPLLALSGRRLTRLEGFVFGVAAGAGFAIVESTLYGVLGLGNRDSWSTLMLMRGGTAVMHCLASGLAGLGWQAMLSERRWTRGLALGLAAVAVHGTWNVAALGQALISLQGLNGAASSTQVVGFAAVVLLFGLLAVLWLASVITLPLIAGKLAAGQQRRSAAAEIEPVSGPPAVSQEDLVPTEPTALASAENPSLPTGQPDTDPGAG